MAELSAETKSALRARRLALAAGDGDAAQAMPGIAYAVLREGKLVHADAVGVRNPETGAELLPSTAMRVASISKISTALVVLRLVAQRKLSLDADLADVIAPWVRNPAFPKAPITPRLLLTHTSSLRDDEVYWGALGETLADLMTPAGKHWGKERWSSKHAPGAFFSYCNLAFGVLATAAEKVTGARFDQLAHELVFGPLGMQAGFNWSEVPDLTIAHASALYRKIDGAWKSQTDWPLPVGVAPVAAGARHPRDFARYEIGSHGSLFSPQGGLRASVLDLSRIAALLIASGAPLLKPADAAPLFTPAWRFDGANGDTLNGFYLGQSVGLHVLPADEKSPIVGQERVLFGHAAEAFGLLGGLYIDREARAGFIYLFNGGPNDGDRKKGRTGFNASEEAALNALYPVAMGA
jgi:CubicO group peptidase (beta-lactamase class C family)